MINDKIVIARNVVFSQNSPTPITDSQSSSTPIAESEPLVAATLPIERVHPSTPEAVTAPTPIDSNEAVLVDQELHTTPETPEVARRVPLERTSKTIAASGIRSLFNDKGRALTTTTLDDLPPEDIIVPRGQIGFGLSNKGPLKPYWEAARQDEINKQIRLGVFEVCKPPEGANIIRGHFIHSGKFDSFGKLKKMKARLVADGCGLHGVDYEYTYAPTPSPEIMRMLFTIAANRDFEVHQVDVDSAYLHAPLDTDVYMYVPKGVQIDHDRGDVLHLKRALYGLK